MRFTFSEDQLAFAAALRDVLDKECTPGHVRAVWESGRGHDDRLWSHLAELGFVGMLAPDAAGWTATEVDLLPCLVELGRAATPGPLVEHAAVVVPALAGSAWEADLVAGTLVATAALDGQPGVAHAASSHLVLVPEGVRVVKPDLVTDRGGLDGGRRIADLPDGELVPYSFDVGLGFDRGALATAGYLLGVADRMIEMSVEYASQRMQFGKAIGSYQAVRHMLADALLQVEFARPVVYRAACSVSHADATRGRDVSMAKLFADEAAQRAARVALQVHGALGYTWEADLHLWMKKAWSLRQAWGTPRVHRERVAAAVIGPSRSR